MRFFIIILTSLGAIDLEAFSTLHLCNTKFHLVERAKVHNDWGHDISQKSRCTRCPEATREDSELDQREALFAMLGTLWATTSRFGTKSVNTVYESDAQIEIPKIM